MWRPAKGARWGVVLQILRINLIGNAIKSTLASIVALAGRRSPGCY